MQDYRKFRGSVAFAAALAGGLAVMGPAPVHAASSFPFNLQRSAGLPAACAPNATAHVQITSQGFAEKMVITVSGLPSTAMDLFIIQVPQKPFGVAWYLGDLTTGSSGTVTKTFISRLNEETFAVATGAAPAPKPHGAKDQGANPTFNPIHTFHVGVWFNSPQDASRNHCPTTVTPFNGDHTAGVQVLNSGSFPDGFGPLRHVS